MGTQNLLNNYGKRLDAKINYSEYYDFYLASDERNFQREVVYSDHIIGYTTPRTPQVGNESDSLPLWIDLNNTACTIQPHLTGVSVIQQSSFFSGGNSAGGVINYPVPSLDIGVSAYPQSIISQNYWNQAFSYCDCPYEECNPTPTGESGDTCGGRTGYTSQGNDGVYSIPNYKLTYIDIGVVPYMRTTGSLTLHEGAIPISGNSSVGPFGVFELTEQDSRFKMWQVSANTQAPSQSGATTRNVSANFFTRPDSGDASNPGPEDSSKFNMSGTRRYTISSSTDSSGYYQELNGGYYTGTYKFYGYPYGVLPDRPQKGWTMETLLKLRATGTTTGGTCFSTNYNVEENVRVNPGDGCYDASTNPTTYYTNPAWNTGVTVTNSGVTLPATIDCTEFYKKFGCKTRNPNQDPTDGYICSGLEKNFCKRTCLDPRFKNDKNCLCCATVGYGVPQQEPAGETYSFSYVIDSEGDCVDTACYGMKYTGYDYDTDTWLTARTENLNCTADTRTVNDDYPNNSGFFFYKGTRAENKFHSEFPSETGCTSMSGFNCCMDTIDGHTLGPAVVNTSPFDIATGGTSTTVTMTSMTNDIVSNNLGFRITPDFKIGYRTIRYTGTCETTGGTATGNKCTTGDTFVCGYHIEEKYSDVICPSIINSGSCEDTWIHVAVSFERSFPLITGSSCAQSLGNGVEYSLGGLLDPLYLFSGITAEVAAPRCNNVFDELPLIPEDGYYEFDCSGISGKTANDCCFTAATTFGSWLSHDEYRRGRLVFYVNGRRHFVVDEFEEIIPRTLNQHRDLQVGVPYNIAWGGASIGLLENMTMSPCNESGFSGDTCDLSTVSGGTGFTSYTACTLDEPVQYLEQDPDDLGLLIEKNFAGTWMGGISQLRYYTKPLQADEVYHNFLVNKDRYNLIDCEFTKNCSKNACDSSQTLYLTEGNMYDIKAIFGYLSNNLYFTSGDNQVKFRGYTQENISSIKFYKKFKQEAAVEVTMPVWMNPEDTLECVIIKMDESLDAIVTLLGNTYK